MIDSINIMTNNNIRNFLIATIGISISLTNFYLINAHIAVLLLLLLIVPILIIIGLPLIIKTKTNKKSSIFLVIIIIIIFLIGIGPLNLLYTPHDNFRYFPAGVDFKTEQPLDKFMDIGVFIPKDTRLYIVNNSSQEYGYFSVYFLDDIGDREHVQIDLFNSSNDIDSYKKHMNKSKTMPNKDYIIKYLQNHNGENNYFAWEGNLYGNDKSNYTHILIVNGDKAIDVASTNRETALAMAESVKFDSWYRSFIYKILNL